MRTKKRINVVAAWDLKVFPAQLGANCTAEIGAKSNCVPVQFAAWSRCKFSLKTADKTQVLAYEHEQKGVSILEQQSLHLSRMLPKTKALAKLGAESCVGHQHAYLCFLWETWTLLIDMRLLQKEKKIITPSVGLEAWCTCVHLLHSYQDEFCFLSDIRVTFLLFCYYCSACRNKHPHVVKNRFLKAAKYVSLWKVTKCWMQTVAMHLILRLLTTILRFVKNIINDRKADEKYCVRKENNIYK